MTRGARPLLSLVLVGLAGSAWAQELSPRAYWPAPRGTIVAFSGYSYSWGDVITDPSLPIVGADSRLHTLQVGYLQTVSLFGRTSNIVVELPYTWGSTVGTFDGEPARRDLAGFGDMAFTLSANLRGAPSMTRAEFGELRRNPHSIIGASVKVLAPTGRYSPEKLFNEGSNRWAVKPELGIIYPFSPPWHLELEVGAWFFADNDEFLGVVREQRPVLAVEMHLVRRFRPGFWASLDLNYFTGGKNVIDGELTESLQRNSRVGFTFVFPFYRRHALKLSYNTGVFTEAGGDYSAIVVGYTVLLR